MRRVLVCAVLLAAVTCVSHADVQWQRGNQTEWVRLTENGRSVKGSFSPDGSMVALVSLRKQFTPEGVTYFERQLRLWDGSALQDVARLPDSEPERSPGQWRESSPGTYLTWLAGDDYVLASLDRQKLLVRLSDGAMTKVGHVPGWFVMNDAWQLPKADAIRLSELLRPWSGDRRVSRPAAMPEQSEDWYYRLREPSPANPNLAIYEASDKHFDGCCCTAYMAHRYLGVVDLTTGRMKRLTWGRDHTIGSHSCSWSPDGALIGYVRRPHDDEGNRLASDLHVIRPDGSGDRHLAADVNYFHWTCATQLLVTVGPWEPESYWWSRLSNHALVDCSTGRVRHLTTGQYCHDLLDSSGGRYLIAERPVGQGACSGDLYIVCPL